MKAAVNGISQDKLITHILLYSRLADGPRAEKALAKLAGVIRTPIAYLQKRNLISQLYCPAPKKYWRMPANLLY